MKLIKIFILPVHPYHSYIQMKRKELTKPFMMTSNIKKTFGRHSLIKNNSSATLEMLIFTHLTYNIVKIMGWAQILTDQTFLDSSHFSRVTYGRSCWHSDFLVCCQHRGS